MSGGRTTIAPRVVEAVARRAAGEVDGVEIVDGSGLRALIGSGGASVDVATDQTAVDLELAVCWPQPVRRVTDEVRHHVRARVQELTGYVVTDVDITVASLPSPSRPKRTVL